MRLQLFRTKLIEEINTALKMDPMDQHVQSCMYCIATLLRTVIKRCGIKPSISVRECSENGDFIEKDITLEKVCGVVLHAVTFLPDTRLSWKHTSPRYCKIVSYQNYQSGVDYFLIDLNKFLTETKQIISSDSMLVDGVLRNALTVLCQIARIYPCTFTRENQAIELLVDLFDLLRSIGERSTLQGSAKVTMDAVPPKEALRLLGRRETVPVRSFRVAYSDLVDSLFAECSLSPLRQFRGPTYDLDVHGRKNNSWRIPATEFIKFIKIAQAERQRLNQS